jgi:hypothetical protein
LQRLLTTVTLVGLLVATAAAFAVTERLKLTKSPLMKGTRVSKVFSPACGCARRKATIRIRMRRSDDVTLRILAESGSTVRSLVSNERAPRGINVFKWDGRTDGNVVAKDGVYRAEVHLANQHQTILLPNRISLDTKPPEVANVTLNRDTFSPDGDRQSDFVRVHYELSKPAHVHLYFRGHRVLRTYRHPRTGAFSWFGKVDDGTLAQGWYTLQLGAVDAAGNKTPAAKRWPVRVHVRYIELASKRITVRAGSRFSIGVSTDAKQYRWKLGKRQAFASGPGLTLRASPFRGRYTLTVSENGHVSRATVLVK